jgi:hypothetical protein
MTKCSPYHSISPEDSDVYHDHSDCYEGQKIKPENRAPGEDGRRRCQVCQGMG